MQRLHGHLMLLNHQDLVLGRIREQAQGNGASSLSYCTKLVGFEEDNQMPLGTSSGRDGLVDSSVCARCRTFRLLGGDCLARLVCLLCVAA